MRTLFFYSTLLVTFLCSASNTLAVGPEAEDWNDQDNNPAPAQVIQAANKLWGAVEKELVAVHHTHSVAHNFRFSFTFLDMAVCH